MKTYYKSLMIALLAGCPIASSFAYASPNLGSDAMSADMPIMWLGASDSSVYGMIYGGQFANLLTSRDAVALVLNYGAEEFRLGVTWARVVTPNQRFKISLEHFAQDSNYAFVSGADHEFIGQNQVGAEYEYATLKPWAESWLVNGYYVGANNGDFPDQTFTTPAGTFNNIRGLTGGSGGGIGTGPTWELWHNGRLEVLANYDSINYNTEYQPSNSKSGLGVTVDFTQHLGKRLDLELSALPRSVYQLYTASLTWTAHYSATSQYGVSLQASHMDSSTLIAGNENVVGLNFFYQWNAHKAMPHTPLCFAGDASCDSLGWSTRSAAYVPGVYVQMDQAVFPSGP